MGEEYGYSQAVKVDNTIYVSGQVSHDDKGNIVDEVLFVTDMDAVFTARVKCR